MFEPNAEVVAGAAPNNPLFCVVLLLPNKLEPVFALAPKPVDAAGVEPKPVDGAAAPKPVLAGAPNKPVVAGLAAPPNKPPDVLLVLPNPVLAVEVWPNGLEVALFWVLPKRPPPVAAGVEPKAVVGCVLFPKPPKPVDCPNAPG